MSAAIYCDRSTACIKNRSRTGNSLHITYRHSSSSRIPRISNCTLASCKHKHMWTPLAMFALLVKEYKSLVYSACTVHLYRYIGVYGILNQMASLGPECMYVCTLYQSSLFGCLDIEMQLHSIEQHSLQWFMCIEVVCLPLVHPDMLRLHHRHNTHWFSLISWASNVTHITLFSLNSKGVRDVHTFVYLDCSIHLYTDSEPVYAVSVIWDYTPTTA